MADKKHPAYTDREVGGHPIENLQCTDPEAIEDWELEACIEGDTPPHVRIHLDECRACRSRLVAHFLFERHMRKALYRADCPSLHLLCDYYWDYLSADERQRVDKHLVTCPHCTQELNDLAEFLAVEQEGPLSAFLSRARQAAEQVQLVLAHFVSPVPHAVPALRGETRDVLLFEAGDVALSINVEQEASGAYTLFGQILSPDPDSPPEGYVRLTSAGADARQTSLDTNSGFALPGLRPGVYQLVVHLQNQRVVVPSLALKAVL